MKIPFLGVVCQTIASFDWQKSLWKRSKFQHQKSTYMVWSVCRRKQHTILGSTQNVNEKTPFAGKKRVMLESLSEAMINSQAGGPKLGCWHWPNVKQPQKQEGGCFTKKGQGQKIVESEVSPKVLAPLHSIFLLHATPRRSMEPILHYFRSVEQRQSKELPLKSSCLRTPIITSWHQKHQLLAADFGLLLNCKIQRIGARRKRPRPTPGHAYYTTHEPRFYFVLKSA